MTSVGTSVPKRGAPKPPGPKAGWPLGHLPQFHKDRLGFLARVTRDYGDIVALRFVKLPFVMINHPDLVEEVLVRQARTFVKSVGLRRASPILGQGLLTSEGDFWRRQRRLMQPAFHRDRIQVYGTTMVDYALRALAEWKDGETRDIHADMMRLTLQIAAKTLFNHDIGQDDDRVSHALDYLLKQFLIRQGRPPFLDKVLSIGNRRWHQAIRDLESVVYGIIQQRRASGTDPGDLLSLLMQARDEAGQGMTDRQLRDEVMTLLLAGHETTANALTWTWHLLSQNPQVDELLATELGEVLGGRPPTPDDLPHLPYTQAVITESMRLYPPAWILGREATASVSLGGYVLDAGTTVIMSQWTMHRRPDYYPEPEAFQPERWLGNRHQTLPTYAYFPFGGGQRLCIGRSFALLEATLLLAVIAQRFRMERVPDHPVVLEPSITLRPKHGLRVVVRKRVGQGSDSPTGGRVEGGNLRQR